MEWKATASCLWSPTGVTTWLKSKTTLDTPWAVLEFIVLMSGWTEIEKTKIPVKSSVSIFTDALAFITANISKHPSVL
jgi:hypothetical protein